MREKELASVKITQFFLFHYGTIESRAWWTIFDEYVKNWFAFLGRLSPCPEEHFTTHVHSVNFRKILNLCNSTVFSISGHVVGLTLSCDAIQYPTLSWFRLLCPKKIGQKSRNPQKFSSPLYSTHRFTCELFLKSYFLSEPTNQLWSICVVPLMR